MKLIAYCRVSTADKGQDPRRQEDVLREWVAREGHELAGVVLDEGTSGSITPLERPMVQEAIRLANREGAAGILAESVDRWTRGGVEDFFATSFTLRLRHKLEVKISQVPPGMTAEMMAVFQAMQAAGAREYRENMNRQIQSGIRRAQRNGWPKGRPGRDPKPNLSPEESAYVREQKALGRRGAGWGRMSNELTRRRGAWEVADKDARERRIVTSSWLRAEWERIERGSMVRTWRKGPHNVAGAGLTEASRPGGSDQVAKGPEASL